MVRLTGGVSLDPGARTHRRVPAGAIAVVICGLWVGKREAERVHRGGCAVAPNFDHIDNTKPGTRSKEGNNVFGCVKTERRPYKDKRDPMAWPMGSGSLSEGNMENKEGATRGGMHNKTHCNGTHSDTNEER
jgi:hypothetical protein